MSPRQRILLVEDNPRDIDLVLSALETPGLAKEVAVARDGVEALDFLYHRGVFAQRDPGLPAVVLLDIRMPRLGGIEVLRQMKSEPRFKNIPVVMLTVSHDEPDLAVSYALGANAYVVKPVDLANFNATIREVGAFWAMLNEPPAGSTPSSRPAAPSRLSPTPFNPPPP